MKEENKEEITVFKIYDKKSARDFTSKMDFSKLGGLVPAIAQDYLSNEVLMLAFMNQEALIATIDTGYAHYFSRSRQKLWKKGETSGHIQEVTGIFFDCDMDSILLKIKQTGPSCHTGRGSCFYSKVDYQNAAERNSSEIYEKGKASTAEDNKNSPDLYYSLKNLYDTAASRKGADPEKSYVSRLLSGGPEKIGKKLLEECLEVILSVKEGESRGKIIYEAADLLFFYTVMLVCSGVDYAEVITELKRREGLSGLDEKNARFVK